MKFFLSFNEKDAAFADELRESLARRGLDVWNPRLLYPGSNWLLETGQALEQSEAVIFIVSKNTVDSASLRAEVQFVIGRLKYENRVFVVMLQQRVRMPWILERMAVIKAADRDAHRAARQILMSIRSAARSAAAKVAGGKTPAKRKVAPEATSNKARGRRVSASDKAKVRDANTSSRVKVHLDRGRTLGGATRKTKENEVRSAALRKQRTGARLGRDKSTQATPSTAPKATLKA